MKARDDDGTVLVHGGPDVDKSLTRLGLVDEWRVSTETARRAASLSRVRRRSGPESTAGFDDRRRTALVRQRGALAQILVSPSERATASPARAKYARRGGAMRTVTRPKPTSLVSSIAPRLLQLNGGLVSPLLVAWDARSFVRASWPVVSCRKTASGDLLMSGLEDLRVSAETDPVPAEGSLPRRHRVAQSSHCALRVRRAARIVVRKRSGGGAAQVRGCSSRLEAVTRDGAVRTQGPREGVLLPRQEGRGLQN